MYNIMMKLEDIVDIIIPKKIENQEREGKKVLVISQTNFATSSYTTECGKLKSINNLKNSLKQFDILIGKYGKPIFKIAIIGEIHEPLYAQTTLYILRQKSIEEIENNSIFLYMYLKSDKGQKELNNLLKTKAGTISKTDLKEIPIPMFDKIKSQVVGHFYHEERLCNEIQEVSIRINTLHQVFDDKVKGLDLGMCKMCNSIPATHLRVDTWQPLKRGIPICDICSKHIMF